MKNQHPTNQSVLEKLDRRAKRRDLISKLFLYFFILSAFALAATYWVKIEVPRQLKEEYDQETAQLTQQLIATINGLTEWHTTDSIQQHIKQIGDLAKRDDAPIAEIERFHKKIKTIQVLQTDRKIRFEKLLDQTKTFPTTSNTIEIDAHTERIRLAMGDYQPERGKVLKDAWRAKRKEITTAYATDSGTMIIRSSPSKAKVYIDGKYVDTTPFRAERVPQGTHELRLSKKNYRDLETSFNMSKNGELSLEHLILTPILGNLRVEVNSGNTTSPLRIEIEQRIQEGTPDSPINYIGVSKEAIGSQHTFKDIIIGSYIINIIYEHHLVAESTATVTEGKTTQIQITL